VLVRDDAGRILLVRQKDGGQWTTIGGSVEPDESPAEAAVREAEEEAGVAVELTGLVAALGGPAYRLRYANGDEVACVPIVFAARVVGGVARADDDETSEVGWYGVEDLRDLDVNDLNRALLAACLPELA
jgi:8-oxo-dGTP pyrophosphatase MutT (NUDIX family)